MVRSKQEPDCQKAGVSLLSVYLFREELRRMDAESLSALLTLMGEQKRISKILEESKGKEEIDMCDAIDELIEDGKREGIALGKEAGIALGKEAGIALGKEAGIALGKEAGIALGKEVGIALGKEAGLLEGQRRMAELTRILLKDNLPDVLLKATEDERVRDELFEQYHI